MKTQLTDLRDDPFALLAAIEKRLQTARVDLAAGSAQYWTGLGFRLGDRWLVAPREDVREVIALPPLTRVPGARPWLLGLANVRGSLLPVVDLKQFLEGDRTVVHEGQRVLVMRQAGGDVALTIDELYGQRSFHESQQVEPGDLAEGRYGHFIDRAFASDDQRWGVFALGLLARTPEFRQTAL